MEVFTFPRRCLGEYAESTGKFLLSIFISQNGGFGIHAVYLSSLITCKLLQNDPNSPMNPLL